MKLYALLVAMSMVTLSWLSPVWADSIIEDVPAEVKTSKRYIFYMHGTVEEDEGSTEKYEAAVKAIAGGKNVVITEVRGDTDPNVYAEKIRSQVAKLQQAGVAKRNITITGFSKGAIIALAVAGAIQDPEMKYVLLAGCSEELNEKYSVDPAKARGRVLAIYDADDDEFGSCKGIINPGEGITLKEEKLNSGKGHALFRIPKDKFIDQWRGPLMKWTKKK
jgi:hypothetical protein